MFRYLHHIYDPRERLLVGLADIGLTALAWPLRFFRTAAATEPRRILVLRLERIGDLLMTLGPLESVRRTWPSARIDLVVGSWNRDIAAQLPWVDEVHVLDVPWLSRGTAAAGLNDIRTRVTRWRAIGYDLAINLEGDIRSNVLLAVSGAAVRVGFAMAGGGSVLTHAAEHDPARHTETNAQALVREAARAFGRTPTEAAPAWPRFPVPAAAAERARQALEAGGWDGRSPLVGVHPSGGRAIKQWHGDRFGRAAGRIAKSLSATVVFTGTRDEAAAVGHARAALPPGIPAIDVSGDLDLLQLAAVLQMLTIYVTGDTGPMHLAAAMGTPVVALFGVSDPRRYAPLGPLTRVVRIDLPCSPCNRVRLPPTRCRGKVPDCLEGIDEDRVVHDACSLLHTLGVPAGLRDQSREAP